MTEPWEQFAPEPEPWGAFKQKEAYNPLSNDDGQEERILFENTGEEIKAPAGSSELLAQIDNDDAFDPPSSTFEEASGTFEKQAAYIGLLANAYGIVADQDVATFVADRSRALAHAQKNQPDYMNKFNRQFQDAKGFWETAGVFLSNPRALGRVAVAQSPNSVIPLLTTYFGAQTGGIIGSVGGPVTAGIGAVAGGVTGSFPGSAMIEIGSTLDQLMVEQGVDITDARQVLTALQNKPMMEGIRKKAEAKGITTAAVDSLFQVFGGRFLKSFSGAGKIAKAGAAIGDIGIQSVGEFAGEAAGQQAAFGRVDYKDAALEAVSSIAQSVGQTSIGATAGKAKETVGDLAEEPRPAQGAAPMIDTTTGERKIEIDQNADAAQALSALPVEGVQKQQIETIVKDFLNGVEPDTTNFTEAQEEAIQGVLDRVAPVREQIIKGRIKNLDVAVENKLKEVDAAEAELSLAVSEGRGTQRIEARIEKLSKEWEALDAERGELFTIEDPIRESADLLKKEITVKGDVLEGQNIKATKRTILAVNAAFRKARVAVSADIKNVQKLLGNAIRTSGLPEKLQGDFIGAITGIQTHKQLKKQAPKIQARIEAKINEVRKSNAIADIRKLLKRAAKSKAIAADYAIKIEDMFKGVDVKNRSQQTLDRLKKTFDFVERGGVVPEEVLKELDVIGMKRLADFSPSELEAMAENIRDMMGVGRTKQKLKVLAAERRKKQRLLSLSAQIKPINSTPLKTASIGERIGVYDQIKNRFLTAANYARNVSLALNPMDVFFDMLDNNADYKGPAHTIFKKAIDADFSKYLNQKESLTREIKAFADKAELDDRNFERIGVYAAAQQKGGIEKLKATGVSQEQIENISLSSDERAFYDLMRKNLDSMFPAINKVMIDVYNKNVEQVDDYFPFMTDFEAMNETQIQDMFGEDAPLLAGPTREATQKMKKKNVEKGFTQSRKGGAQVIKLDAMEVFLKHVDNATYLINLSQNIKELGELAQSDEFRAMAGDSAQEMIVDWIDLLARKGRAPNRVAALDALRRNTGAAVLGFKLSSILIQPTALMDGASLIGGNYVARGATEIATNREWREFLVKNMPELRERVGDDMAYMEMGGKSIVGKIQEAGMWALKNLDFLSASSVAAGAYIRSVEQRGGEIDLNVPDQQAIQEAQFFLRRTQSSPFAKDAPQIISVGKLTGNASLDKLIFQFQSFMLNRWSIIKHDMVKIGIGRGKTAQALNAAMFLTLAGMAEIGVRRLSKEMIGALVGSDDLDPWEDTIKEEAVSTALNQVPFVSNIVGSMEYGSNPVPSIALANDVFKKLQYGASAKSDEKKSKNFLGAGILATGAAFGLPGTLQAEQAMRKAMTDDNASKKGF